MITLYEEEPREELSFKPDERRPFNPGPIFETTMIEELEQSRVDPLCVTVFITI